MSTTTYNLECAPGSVFNPKSDKLKPAKRGGLRLFDLKNPIPGEIEDSADIQQVFQQWPLVPYAGSQEQSGDTLLAWYDMLEKLSPTHGSCIKKKNTYAFGSKVIFRRAEDPEFASISEAQPMTASESERYMQALKEFIEFEDGIRKVCELASTSYQSNGNAFIEVRIGDVMEEKRVHIEVKKIRNVRYVRHEEEGPKAVAISHKWSKEYLEKNPPRVVPMFPVFEEREDGVLCTMFHLKAGANKWYGRPDSEQADVYKYREVQDSVYLAKQSAGNFTGQIILEFEDDDPLATEQDAKDAGYKNAAERIADNYTQKSDDPQSIMTLSRPPGSRPMSVFQVSPNTNENWYKVTGDLAAEKVMIAHQCTKRFMAFDAPNGFASDAFLADYVINMEPVINAHRDTIMNFLNGIINEVWTLLGMDEMRQYSITFQAPIQSSIDAYKSSQIQAPAQAQTQA